MGKKKKKNGKGFHLPIPHISFEIPERAKRMILGIVLVVLAGAFVFAFFDKAGIAGQLLLQGTQFLLGRGVFVFPVFLVVCGGVLWSMRKYSSITPFLTLFLLIVGVSGILSTFARSRGLEVREFGGLLGAGISWPAFTAFGFWVSEIIFLAVVATAGVIFWQLFPHEQKDSEKASFAEGAKEKVKKIFEPKFEVSEVEIEPKVMTSTVFEDEDDDDENEDEEEQKEKKEKKKKDAISPVAGDFTTPPVDLLEQEKGAPNAGDIKTFSAIIKKTLQNFDIPVEVSEVNVGPAVTQYAFKPAEGIKLSKITSLQNDLALALAAHPLRIEAPIPGKALVGIEIPNKVRATVRLRSLVEDGTFQNATEGLSLALGKDVSGTPIYADLARMPHLLVAGATGSGKTIGLTNIIISLLYKNPPSRLRLILVDPKRVEFPVYNDLPHLLTPVIFDTQKTLNALKWLIKEMDRRFSVFSDARVRDIRGYHVYYAAERKKGKEDAEEIPYIITVIDELADLMAARGKDLEGMIVRLAQMARAVGIHLVLATQRPSVEVITGLIKANMPSRIAFQVASQIDSRTILDSGGAEKLLGQGDMLFVSSEFSKPRRIQGAYISEKEVKKIVEWIAAETEEIVREDMETNDLAVSAQQSLEDGFNDEDDDPLYEEAKRVVGEAGKASASLLQRRLKVGYARAARLLDLMEEKGVVGSAEGAKPREVYGERTQDGASKEKDSEWISP
jgi:DNA segregation ATPase FtsK/SpoIIIE, S-DNA-T family